MKPLGNRCLMVGMNANTDDFVEIIRPNVRQLQCNTICEKQNLDHNFRKL